jgi:hypothetical protein
MSTNPPERLGADHPEADWLEVVRRKVGSLRFGSVQITVHDGQVTQVESVEKTRIGSLRDKKTRDPG